MDDEVYERGGYRLAGSHSAVKTCSWTRKSLRQEGACYKQKFYGINSHRCLQMTPAVAWCEHKCEFCWRPVEFTKGTSMEEVDVDDPGYIIDEAIKAQRELLTGFKGNPKTPRWKYEEAVNPNQAAISLTGEPTLYPKLSGLIKEFHNRGFTTFLVTNGMNPSVLSSLNPLPTQLYVSLVASNEDDYIKVTNSSYGRKGWKRLLKSVNLMKDLDTRTVIRLTLVKGLNLKNPSEYAGIIRKAGPDFVEAKAYMYVGSSRERLSMSNMPSFEEIRTFSAELATELGWRVISKHERSRVCLIAPEDYDWRKL